MPLGNGVADNPGQHGISVPKLLCTLYPLEHVFPYYLLFVNGIPGLTYPCPFLMLSLYTLKTLYRRTNLLGNMPKLAYFSLAHRPLHNLAAEDH